LLNAVYDGSTTFATSTSPNVNQTVNKIASSTALTSQPNPSAQGQLVTFTATVTAAAGTPTGVVKFKRGTVLLGTVTLSGGVATFSTSTLPRGNELITATYGGATNWLGSSGSMTQVVQ